MDITQFEQQLQQFVEQIFNSIQQILSKSIDKDAVKIIISKHNKALTKSINKKLLELFTKNNNFSIEKEQFKIIDEVIKELIEQVKENDNKQFKALENINISIPVIDPKPIQYKRFNKSLYAVATNLKSLEIISPISEPKEQDIAEIQPSEVVIRPTEQKIELPTLNIQNEPIQSTVPIASKSNIHLFKRISAFNALNEKRLKFIRVQTKSLLDLIDLYGKYASRFANVMGTVKKIASNPLEFIKDWIDFKLTNMLRGWLLKKIGRITAAMSRLWIQITRKGFLRFIYRPLRMIRYRIFKFKQAIKATIKRIINKFVTLVKSIPGKIAKLLKKYILGGIKTAFNRITSIAIAAIIKIKNLILKKIPEMIAKYGGKLLDIGKKLISRAKTAVTKVITSVAKHSKVALSVAKKIAGPVASVGKYFAKFTGKSGLKKIPLAGVLFGAVFAGQRIVSGDFAGAAMEVASGAASLLHLVPGVGTAAALAISVGIDAGIAARDIVKEGQQPPNEITQPSITPKSTLPKTIPIAQAPNIEQTVTAQKQQQKTQYVEAEQYIAQTPLTPNLQTTQQIDPLPISADSKERLQNSILQLRMARAGLAAT